MFLATLFSPLAIPSAVSILRLSTYRTLQFCNFAWRVSNVARRLMASVRAQSKSKSMTFVQVLHRPPLVACAMRTNGNGWGLARPARATRKVYQGCVV